MGEKIIINMYREELPAGVHGALAETGGGYIVLLNTNDPPARQLAAFLHEMTHIYNGDTRSPQDAGEIEDRTHRQLLEALDMIREEAQGR